jgi:transcription initiation factor IIE alpha subunit
MNKKNNKMLSTLHECKSSYYATNFVICSICKERAGYDYNFDNNIKRCFKCGKGLKEIKNDNRN